jgi:ectoine hydroxylase-related dioxygenase (phytanoyl-CoA dioxygenase family)
MKTKLNAAQIKSYRNNGFIAVPGFLSPKELKQWRKVTQAAVDDRLKGTRGFEGLNNQAKPDDFYSQVFVQCVKPADTFPAMRKLIFDPRIGEMAAKLAGVDGIRVWHDQALFKQPFGNPTGYHLDNPYWSFSSRDSISIWIALDDATLENGCMWYLPGTHKVARWENAGIGTNLGDLFKIYPEWKKIKPVPAPAKAGTAVFHNGLVAHGAGANMTNGPRRAMTCAFMPDGSTFNGKKNVLPEEYFKSLKEGDVLNDEKINPLIWAKTTPK